MASASGSVISSETSPATSVRICFQTWPRVFVLLGDERGVGGDPPEHAPAVDLADLLDARGVEKQPHGVVLPSCTGRRHAAGAGRRAPSPLHDQVDHRGERLVEVVVGDDRDAVRQGLATSRIAAACGCSRTLPRIAARAARSRRYRGRRSGSGACPRPRPSSTTGTARMRSACGVEESRYHVRALDDDARSPPPPRGRRAR